MVAVLVLREARVAKGLHWRRKPQRIPGAQFCQGLFLTEGCYALLSMLSKGSPLDLQGGESWETPKVPKQSLKRGSFFFTYSWSFLLTVRLGAQRQIFIVSKKASIVS